MIEQLCGIKYFINILWNFAVYRSKISYVNELKIRLIDEWAQFDQLIVDAAMSQWRRRLNAMCLCTWGHTSSINSDNFETNCYTNLNSGK